MADSAFVTPLRRLRSETDWLRREFASASKEPTLRRSQLTCEMAVIRLYDSWARFCREAVIISAYGKTRTLGGTHLMSSSRPDITKKSTVIPVLISTYRKCVYEPDWDRADKCIDAGQRLSIPNLSTLSSAIGATNSPANEIRYVRNFYAHRRAGSCAHALATNHFAFPRKPIVFKLNEFTVGGSTVIDSWASRLVAIATAAVQ